MPRRGSGWDSRKRSRVGEAVGMDPGSGAGMTRLWHGVCAGLVLMLACGTLSAQAQETPPDYSDDRSTPEALVASFYNAVGRGEYLRAWSYWGADEAPDYEGFEAGFVETDRVRVKTGEARSEGAAGSIFAAVPTVVEATALDRAVTVYAGCYETRLVQPAAQITPPFRPLHIFAASLAEVDAAFDAAEGDCPEEGL